jgi:hypothetical protein
MGVHLNPLPASQRHATLAAYIATGIDMKPEIRIASWLMASVFS